MQPHDIAWAAGQIITVDGDTVLAYDAETEAPSWLSTLDADIAAMAASDELLVVATADKIVRGCDPKSGDEMWRHGLDGAAFSVTVTGNQWAVAFTDTVVQGEGATLGESLPASGVTVVMLRDGGGELAVGTANGLSVVGVDEVTRAEIENISGILPGERAGWFVTAGAKLYHLDFNLEIEGGTQMSDTLFSMPSISPNGRYISVRVDDDYVAVYTAKGLQQAGRIAYKERTIGRVIFGPKNWLAVAVGEGHANKIHLGDDQVCRTDEHPGRTRGSWMLSYKAEDGHWGAAPAGGVGPAEVAAPAAEDDEEPSSAMAAVGVVVAIAVGIAVYFMMQ